MNHWGSRSRVADGGDQTHRTTFISSEQQYSCGKAGLARYLVKARPKKEKLEELRKRVDAGEISRMQPFGRALDYSLRNARVRKYDGLALWEEEDYCSPPLAQEREAVLDNYFDGIETERVEQGQAWKQISELPPLWNLLKRR